MCFNTINIFHVHAFLRNNTNKNKKRTKHMPSKINKSLETRHGNMDDEGASDISLEQLGLAVLYCTLLPPHFVILTPFGFVQVSLFFFFFLKHIPACTRLSRA